MMIDVDDTARYETWEHTVPGTTWVNRYDALGGPPRPQMVAGKGRQITLSPSERRRNQSECMTAKNDPFTNGRLVALRLIDTEEDTVRLRESPNMISDAEIRELFTLHWKQAEKRVAAIDQPAVLRRMLEIGHEVDTTVNRLKTIQARLDELGPEGPTTAGAASDQEWLDRLGPTDGTGVPAGAVVAGDQG